MCTMCLEFYKEPLKKKGEKASLLSFLKNVFIFGAGSRHMLSLCPHGYR